MAKNKALPKPKLGLRSRRPIADKLIKKFRNEGGKVIDFGTVAKARMDAEELEKSVAGREDLHRVHAIYAFAQNMLSITVEELSSLPETDRLTRILEKAEDEYHPSGPPMSPLTKSFFTCWACFDVGVGLGRETFTTITMALWKCFEMDDEILHTVGLMQNSRMAVYVNEGVEGKLVVLRELVTNRTCRAICPAGYIGQIGELWYARVLPPPVPVSDEHIVFTTPYILVETSEQEWLDYFDRTLPEGPPDKRIAAYEEHMKWGPTSDYWTEFVFKGFVDHQTDAIFLTGIPDSVESRSHSPVNT